MVLCGIDNLCIGGLGGDIEAGRSLPVLMRSVQLGYQLHRLQERESNQGSYLFGNGERIREQLSQDTARVYNQLSLTCELTNYDKWVGKQI